MTADSMEFVSSDAAHDYGLWISGSAISEMMASAELAGRNETGGILIGRYDPEGLTAEIVEATPKPQGSRAGWFWFQRGDGGLRALLNDRWRSGLYYLGEWHFHPGGSPELSSRDIQTMHNIAKDSRYRCRKPILLILGGIPAVGFKVSATVFAHELTLRLTQRK